MFGSIYYKINQSLGWIFGPPTVDEIVLYSDLAWGVEGGYISDYILMEDDPDKFKQYDDKAYKDPVRDGKASDFLTYENFIHSQALTEDDYKAGPWFLLGITFFPWNAPIQDSQGVYRVRVKSDEKRTKLPANPMRSGVLYQNTLTIAKIVGISAGLWFGGKFAYKKLMKPQN
jgi:hypothetical protein